MNITIIFKTEFIRGHSICRGPLFLGHAVVQCLGSAPRDQALPLLNVDDKGLQVCTGFIIYLKGLTLIFAGQENILFIFRSKEVYIYFKANVTWSRGMCRMSGILIVSQRLLTGDKFLYLNCFEFKELFISLQPDARLRWGVDQNVAF